jgi:Rps23 Pro-64 3,4-dihydroxylase Tpa1-like proline 4-hydroxylase
MFVDIESLQNRLPELVQEWHTSDSHRALVIDRVLVHKKQERLFRTFPESSWAGWTDISDSLQFRKLSCERIEIFPKFLAMLVHELNSGPVVSFLEELTGIRGLLADPHLSGGGLHYMAPGGYLWPHTDFLLNKHGNLKRLINLILFMHPYWRSDMGGNFELWNGNRLVRSIVPKPGRCLIFRTDSHSTHGVSQIMGKVPRVSIALYYYGVIENQVLLDHTTGWRLTLPPDGSQVNRSRRLAASLIMNTALRLKQLAIRLNEKAEQLVNTRK